MLYWKLSTQKIGGVNKPTKMLYWKLSTKKIGGVKQKKPAVPLAPPQEGQDFRSLAPWKWRKLQKVGHPKSLGPVEMSKKKSTTLR